MIEILDGKLLSTKKYRGTMGRVVRQLTKEFPQAQGLETDALWLIYGEAERRGHARGGVEELACAGYRNLTWVKTGCVIAAHSGPGAFGIVGFAWQIISDKGLSLATPIFQE